MSLAAAGANVEESPETAHAGTAAGSRTSNGHVTIAVGTTNRAKVESVKAAAGRMFSAHSVWPYAAERFEYSLPYTHALCTFVELSAGACQLTLTVLGVLDSAVA